MNINSIRKGLFYIALIDMIILTLGVVGSAGLPNMIGIEEKSEIIKYPGFLGNGHLSFLGLSIGLIAIITFLGTLRLGPRDEKGTLSEEWIRRTIVISVVAVYLVIVSVFAFLQGYTSETPPLVSTLVTSFTGTVSVVVAFYFGSTAYIEARTKRETDAESKE